MGESVKNQGGWRTNKWVRAAIPALLLHCSIGTVYCWSIFSQEIADYMRALKNSHFFAGAFSFQHINSTYIQKCSKTYKKMPLY